MAFRMPFQRVLEHINDSGPVNRNARPGYVATFPPHRTTRDKRNIGIKCRKQTLAQLLTNRSKVAGCGVGKNVVLWPLLCHLLGCASMLFLLSGKFLNEKLGLFLTIRRRS